MTTRTKRNAAKIAAALRGKKKTRAKKKHPPLSHEEAAMFSKTCDGCGEKVTQAGGEVKRVTKADGYERFHYFGYGGK